MFLVNELWICFKFKIGGYIGFKVLYGVEGKNVI